MWATRASTAVGIARPRPIKTSALPRMTTGARLAIPIAQAKHEQRRIVINSAKWLRAKAHSSVPKLRSRGIAPFERNESDWPW
jgi:hypothetical protein